VWGSSSSLPKSIPVVFFAKFYGTHGASSTGIKQHIYGKKNNLKEKTPWICLKNIVGGSFEVSIY